MAKHKCVTHSAIKLNLLANDPSAWAEVWAGSNPARASYPMAPGGGVLDRFYHIFEILHELGDINYSTSLPNY